MSEDWQDLALNNRRLPHGKTKKGGKAAGRHGARDFSPRKAVGSYKLSTDNVAAAGFIDRRQMPPLAVLEIHEFTQRPGGYVASLSCGHGKLKAAVLLAGSRKLLKGLVEDEEEGSESSDEAQDDTRSSVHDDSDSSGRDEQYSETSMEAVDRKINERARAFEKNSFRQPKFWLQWQGEIRLEDQHDGSALDASRTKLLHERSVGYLTFDRMDCESFMGTLNCKTLSWKNLAIKGAKTTSAAAPPPFSWRDLDEANSDNQPGSGRRVHANEI